MKLLAIDMDGTCLNSKRKLTNETLDALIKAKEEGVEIVPITGRPFNFLPKSILENDLCRYVITSNGLSQMVMRRLQMGCPALLPHHDMAVAGTGVELESLVIEASRMASIS